MPGSRNHAFIFAYFQIKMTATNPFSHLLKDIDIGKPAKFYDLKAVETFKVAKKLLLKLGIIYKRKNHQISQNLSTYTSIPYVTKEGKWVKKKGW